MSCPFSPEDISAYTDGELGEGDEEKLKHHLQHCARCANLADSFAAISATLRSRPAPELSRSLADTVAAEVATRREPRTLSCKAALRAASAYLDAELPASEAERLEAHLLGCSDCADQFELLRLCVPESVPERPVPAGLHQRIMAAVAESHQRGPWAGLAEAWQNLRWAYLSPARAWAPAVALATVAVLTWAVVLPRLAHEAPTSIAERPAPSVAPETAPVEPEPPTAEEVVSGGAEQEPVPRTSPTPRMIAERPRVPAEGARPRTDEEADLTEIFEVPVETAPDPLVRERLVGDETPENVNSVGSAPVMAELPAEPEIAPVAAPADGEYDEPAVETPEDIWATG